MPDTAQTYSETVQTARDYYNSGDADNFYSIVWGGEDIHIGLYDSEDDSIRDASRRTVTHLAEIPEALDSGTAVLDVGSGYGGAARYLASKYGARVTALNLSERENARARELNAERGMDELIEVIDGSFEEIPAEDDAFDLVWSQDAILHSGDRGKVMAEVARVLKPGGEFVFTDPMQADSCPDGVLEPILARIHLESLGSPGFYRKAGTEAGFAEMAFVDKSDHLVKHYTRVLEETEALTDQLMERVSEAYLRNMKEGLSHWIEGGRNGYLTWGVFHFRLN